MRRNRPLVAAWLGLLLAGPAPAQAPRLDLYGDPLPPQAVARLGTVRFRFPGASAGLQSLFYSADGTLLFAATRHTLHGWEAATGRVVFRSLVGDYTPAHLT